MSSTSLQTLINNNMLITSRAKDTHHHPVPHWITKGIWPRVKRQGGRAPLWGSSHYSSHLVRSTCRRRQCILKRPPGWFLTTSIMENQVREGEVVKHHLATRLPGHKLKFGVAEILGAGVGSRGSTGARSRSPQSPLRSPITPETSVAPDHEINTWSKAPLSSPSPPTPTPTLPHPALLRLSLPRPSFSTSSPSPIFSPPLLFPYTSSPFLQSPPLAQPSLPANPIPFLQTQHLSAWYPSKFLFVAPCFQFCIRSPSKCMSRYKGGGRFF